MATMKMTKRQLLNYDNECNEWQRHGSILSVLLRGRIQDFYKEFGGRIATLHKDLEDLHKRYYEFEYNKALDRDVIKMVEKKYVFLEGKEQKDFDMEFNSILDQPMTDRTIILNHGMAIS